MSTPNNFARLNWSIFAVRWLLVLGVLLLALLNPTTPAAGSTAGALMLAALMGVLFGGMGGILALWNHERRLPGAIGVGLDTLYALIIFVASGGYPLALIVAGMLPVLHASLRIGGIYGFVPAVVLVVTGTLFYGLLLVPDGAGLPDVLMAAGALLLLTAFVSLPGQWARLGYQGEFRRRREQEAAANQLRVAREQARILYEMSSTLSATLKYEDVLDAALDIGFLGLRDTNRMVRLTGAVMLYDDQSNQLMVITGRGLTRTDLEKKVPGRRGVLGLALHQAQPVFASDARRDPELQYFVAFQEAQSILALPLRAGYENFGVLVFGSTLPNTFSENNIELLTSIASQATIALQNATLYQDLLDEKERIIEVEEDARKQLSRDLHDGPTQSIAAIAMRINFTRRLLTRDPGGVPAELQKVEELARQTTKEIRHMLFTLRPYILETKGLTAALEELASKVHENYSQQVIVDIEPNVQNFIDSNDQGVLFNIAEEAVNNARKHAEAALITVRLGKRENYIWLEVEDNGVGFDLGEVDANYDQRGSLGMVNLRERAELLNGQIRIESAEGAGTKVILMAPIRPLMLARSRTGTDAAPANRSLRVPKKLAEKFQTEQDPAAAENPRGSGPDARPTSPSRPDRGRADKDRADKDKDNGGRRSPLIRRSPSD